MAESGRRMLLNGIYMYSENPNKANGTISVKTKDKVLVFNGTEKISEPIFGSPFYVLRRILDLGFEKGYYKRNIIRKLIEYGFDKDYWDDIDVTQELVSYFAQDKFLWKKERLEKLEKEEEYE